MRFRVERSEHRSWIGDELAAEVTREQERASCGRLERWELTSESASEVGVVLVGCDRSWVVSRQSSRP